MSKKGQEQTSTRLSVGDFVAVNVRTKDSPIDATGFVTDIAGKKIKVDDRWFYLSQVSFVPTGEAIERLKLETGTGRLSAHCSGLSLD